MIINLYRKSIQAHWNMSGPGGTVLNVD